MKAIRICALGVPRFKDGGLEVGPRWTAVAELSEKQRAALRDYHGRFIRIHPEDRDHLAELALRFDKPDKPLVDLAKGQAPKNAPAAPAPAAAPKTTTPKNAPAAPAPPKTKNEER